VQKLVVTKEDYEAKRPLTCDRGGKVSCIVPLFSEESCNQVTSNRDEYYVRFEVFSAVTMKNGVFCDVTPCVSC
jgi:hypothetical protein